jgi:predicted ATPase
VGREAELAQLRGLLEGGARLVSVLGIGGTGKTRLALHAARESLSDWPGGACSCDLSEARSLEGIAQAVARSLEVALGKEEPVEQLGHAIAGRGKCLVILDNFEQVSRHAEPTLGAWLERCSEATFLVTTREVLGLPGERSLLLPPLAVEEAAALFETRARQHGRELREEERAEVEELVSLLDRLPLAIELAAARVRIMTPAQLLEKMGDRFRLLTSGGRRPGRQATLEAALDWSWDLLGDWERSALAQLSVFEGGFTLAAADEVLDLSAWPDAPWSMDVVQGLLEKSLLVRTRADRFDLLVSVQEYAARRLDAMGPDARRAAEERHGRALAERWLGTFSDVDAARKERRTGAALRSELDNLLAACRRAVRRRDAQLAAHLLDHAASALRYAGPFDVMLSLTEEVLSLDGLVPADRAISLGAQGRALTLLGRNDEALPRLVAAAEELERLERPRAEAFVRLCLGSLHEDAGRPEDALECYTRAVSLSQAAGLEAALASATCFQAAVLTALGRRDEAERRLDEALRLARAEGDADVEGNCHLYTGNLLMSSRRSREARASYEEAMRCFRLAGSRFGETTALANLGAAHAELGELQESIDCRERALAAQRLSGHRLACGIQLGNLGSVYEELGQPEEARVRWTEALEIHREVGFRYGQGYWLSGLARLALAEGRHEEALDLVEQALEQARGYPELERTFSVTLVEVHRVAGNLPAAREAFDFGLERDPEHIFMPLQLAGARLSIAEGEPEKARSQLELLQGLLERTGATEDSAMARHLAELRAQLGEA